LKNKLTFKVTIKPNAKESKILGIQNDAVKIALNASPVKGKANKALIILLAQVFGVKQSQVEILRGDISRIKQVSIMDSQKTLEEVMAVIDKKF